MNYKNYKEKKQMPRKKAKSKMYFTQDTEDAIIAYNKSDDRLLKNDLYVAEIGYAFDKLAENLIHTFKFYENTQRY